MSKTLLRICSILLLASFSTLLCCKDGETGKKESSRTSDKAEKKGRIWDKVNIVQIPLTAGELGLKGKVKSVTYREYLLMPKNGEQIKRLMTKGYNVYDEQGHLIDQNEYDGNDRPKWKCTYAYGPDNRATEWHFIFYEDNQESRTTFKYDDKGNIIEQTEVNAEGKLNRRTVYKYDSDGNRTEEVVYDEKGQVQMMVASKYDDKGNEVEYASKGPDGKVTYKMTAVYDSKGNKLSGETYRGDSLESKWTNKNNPAGKPLEMLTVNVDGSVFSRYIFKYDHMNNIIEEEVHNPSDATNKKWNGTTTYEYDKVGNIIRQTDSEMRDGKLVPTTYIETEYTYHE